MDHPEQFSGKFSLAYFGLIRVVGLLPGDKNRLVFFSHLMCDR